MKIKTSVGLLLLALGAPLVSPAFAAAAVEAADVAAQAGDSGYVASKDSLQNLLNALAGKAGKSAVLSQKAARKQVSGRFDLSAPWGTLTRLGEQMGLIWYFDGQSIYVYESSEIKSSMLALRSANIQTLTDFLQKSGLYDRRYPLKGAPGSSTFYLSGPPVYVDIVLNAAAYLDQHAGKSSLGRDKGPALPGRQRISVIALKNSFVGDRTFNLRGQSVQIPGIASALQSILSANNTGVQKSASAEKKADEPKDALAPGAASVFSLSAPVPGFGAKPSVASDEADERGVTIQAFPATNSLLVKGSSEQVEIIEDLVKQLDVAKRHIELSLWIIDVDKSTFDSLGVRWSGAAGNSKVQVGFNSKVPFTALDGAIFMAEIAALNQKGKADVVTRPVVLTQENVPAIFDHNQTFYAKLEGERTAQLDSVTYGTLINVIPRLSGDASEIEMSLDIEDGDKDDAKSDVNGMPLVRRTVINTVARVPKGKSLLIGGYAVNKTDNNEEKVPLLGDIPLIGGAFRYKSDSATNRLRLFLIEPRMLDNGSGWNADEFGSVQNPGAEERSVQRSMEQLRSYLDRHAIQ
jgi:type III secretion protein C